MQSDVLWYWLCDLSERVIVKSLKNPEGEGITIPLTPSCNPLEEFRGVAVGENPFRLAVFTLWLKHQPAAFSWFEKILDENEELVRGVAEKLALLNQVL